MESAAATLARAPTDEDVAQLLKEFTVNFLLHGYDALVGELHRQLLRHTNQPLPLDRSHFLWLITFFLRFAVLLELDLEHVRSSSSSSSSSSSFFWRLFFFQSNNSCNPAHVRFTFLLLFFTYFPSLFFPSNLLTLLRSYLVTYLVAFFSLVLSIFSFLSFLIIEFHLLTSIFLSFVLTC